MTVLDIGLLTGFVVDENDLTDVSRNLADAFR